MGDTLYTFRLRNWTLNLRERLRGFFLFLFFVGSSILANYFVEKGFFVFAGFIVLYVLWRCVLRYRRLEIQEEFQSALNGVELTAAEIAEGNYDPSTIYRRLKEYEKGALLIPSNIFALLQIARRQEFSTGKKG